MQTVGVDEAGVGPAFGSMWAAAVALNEDTDPSGFRDSKKLTHSSRLRLAERIRTTLPYGLGEVTHNEIDELGMAECRRLVFERALDDYASKTGVEPKRIIVDGQIFRRWRDAVHECHNRADDTFPAVSAASILAKTTRDAQILQICENDPLFDQRYKIKKNKGYLSPEHIAGLCEHGFSELHRKTYKIKGFNRMI